MKYRNAKDILPLELVEALQDYIQGSYLYIPKRENESSKCEKQTSYKIELEKRDRHIYTKYLEGWDNQKIAIIYHLSESSIRRIILKQRQQYERIKIKMNDIIKLWKIDQGEMNQIYDSAWDISGRYVLKVYNNLSELERNIQTLKVLHEMKIPVAEIVCLDNGEEYVYDDNHYYILTRKLSGSNIVNIIEDKTIAYKMGEIIGNLHIAFQKCESKLIFWNNSLLSEMNGWVKEELYKSEWTLVEESEFIESVERLGNLYEKLPTQLIHRDIHFGNFLFNKGNFSGYIDFDLSQRNIRIFDICYFMLGLLVEEEGNIMNKEEWLKILFKVVSGYESKIKLKDIEKKAFPYVMENIELLFIAYFIGSNDMSCAKDAAKIFHFVRENENEIWQRINIA